MTNAVQTKKKVISTGDSVMKSLKPRTLQVSPWNFGWKTSVWRRDPCTLEGYGSIPIAIMWVKQCHKPPMWEGYTTYFIPIISNIIQQCTSWGSLSHTQDMPHLLPSKKVSLRSQKRAEIRQVWVDSDCAPINHGIYMIYADNLPVANIYTHTYIYTHIHTHTYIYIHIHIYTYIYICRYDHMILPVVGDLFTAVVDQIAIQKKNITAPYAPRSFIE
jgi:hypothetical protein